MSHTAIVAQELKKTYPVGDSQIHALDGVDISVARGEFVCVMGPSGSGKSTLLHTLAGLLEPTSGSVEIGGVNIHALTDSDAACFRRSRLGLIFQFFNLVPTLTVEENIALCGLLSGTCLAAARQAMRPLVEFLRLGHRLSQYPSSLSGGEMQRAAIARALLIEPELILADEPTGNLDSRAGEEVLGFLRRACDERGTTILLVTHDLRGASYADRVMVLEDGRLRESMSTGNGGAGG
jgi:putative ABC transport system ATP-binding protein